MSQEIIVPFDENILRLPSCLAIHSQLRSCLNELSSENYVKLIKKLCETNQSRIYGLIRKSLSETIVLALVFYRIHPTTFDVIRFEIHDLIVGENERNRGLGTQLVQYLKSQAKESGISSVILQCDLTNTNAHRFFFRHDFHISSFGFLLNKIQLLEGTDQVNVIDITDLPEKENEELLIRAHNVFLQLRPILSTDQTAYINRIRTVCQSGPARVLAALSNNREPKVLGLAVYRISENIKYSKHIYCDDLVADESSRSLGVGRALINAMKQTAINLGLNKIALDSGCHRGRAHKFYHREGFFIDKFEFTAPL